MSETYLGSSCPHSLPSGGCPCICAAGLLIEDAILAIKKQRQTVSFTEKGIDHNGYHVTVDFLTRPMKLAVLEIEAIDEAAYPVPFDITKRLFGEQLKECPLCSYSLFKRKIGICGGPSSGKSETAKIISHILITKYCANSFHVTEFATSFIQKYNRNPQFLDQFSCGTVSGKERKMLIVLMSSSQIVLLFCRISTC